MEHNNRDNNIEPNGTNQVKTDDIHTLQIIRPIYDQEKFNNESQYYTNKKKGFKRIIPHSSSSPSSSNNCGLKGYIKNLIPIFGWIPSYSLKNDLLADFITGCTVAIMHIPQGMGYALLANLPPIIGIYTAFFPVILYTIFGTSKHISMGTFAVVCIMVGKVVQSHTIITSNPNDLNQILSTNDSSIINGNTSYTVTPIEIASAICLVVGIIQLLMFIFHLGIVTSLLSESLVSGFTTGAAIHVLASQIKEILGISIKNQNNYFEVIFTCINIFKNIKFINWIAVALSATTMLCLIINNEILKSWLRKKCSFPVPMELLLVFGGTLVSRYLNLGEYSIKTLKNIPTGFPEPKIPDLDIVKEIAIDSIPIAMVAYTVSISMALIFAQKLNYEVNSNQELFAMGVSNIFGSFFSCLPFAASLSRSIIQQTVGGKTQIASLISCCWLAVILLWIGPFFEPLPRCILAGIIVVSLKGMLWQVKHFFQFWKLNQLDAIVWILTFLTVILISIDIGLLIGVILSILCIFFKSLKPYVCLLGNIPETEFYVDIKRFKAAKEIPNMKIYHYCGSINFATRTMFKSELCTLLGINLTKEIKRYSKAIECNKQYEGPADFEYLIFDFTAVSYIDPSGIELLKNLIKEFVLLDITIYISGASYPVYKLMRKCGLHLCNENLKFFPTLHDAVYQGKSISSSTINVLI